jgi:putative transposase
MSRVRACRLVGLNRSSLSYQPRRPDDTPVRQRLRELAGQRRRFGYRRLGWLLAREGCRMNHKKVYRLYREEQLTVRRRGRRKRALGTRAPMMLPNATAAPAERPVVGCICPPTSEHSCENQQCPRKRLPV